MFDGAGNYTRTHNWVADKNAAIKITASRMDEEDDSIAQAFNLCFLRTGIAPMSGNIAMGGNYVKDLGDGLVGAPAVRFLTDSTSGMYLAGAGRVNISAGGTYRIEANSSGVKLNGLLDLQAIDAANEGAEIKLRGSPNATVDFEIDQNVDNFRIFTTDKGLLTTPVQRLALSATGKLSTFGTSGASQLNVGTSANFLDITSTDTGSFNLRLSSTNSTTFTFGTVGAVPLDFVTGNVQAARIDTSGNLAVGSTGGDFSRTWRGVYVKAQNATTQVGVGNTTSGASAIAQFSAFGSSANSFYDDALYDNAGAPYHRVNHGSSVTDTRWDFNGTTRFKVDSSGNVTITGGALSGFTSATDSNSLELGYKDVPQVTHTAGSLMAALTHRNKHIYCTSTASDFTIPPNATVAFPIGTVIAVDNAIGSGTSMTITQGAGVTLVWVPSGLTGSRTLADNGSCVARKVATNTWRITGGGLT